MTGGSAKVTYCWSVDLAKNVTYLSITLNSKSWTIERRTRAPRARRRSWRKLRFFRRQQPSTRRRRAREARSPATGISRLADAVGVSRRDVRLVAAIPAAAKTALAVAVAMLVAAAGFVFLVRDVRERHR